MSDTDDLHYYVRALERDLAQYHDELEKYLFEAELARVERNHAIITTVSFIGSMVAAIAFVGWLQLDFWLIEFVMIMATFFGLFVVTFAVTSKPMQREIDNIRKPLTWLPKPRWRKDTITEPNKT